MNSVPRKINRLALFLLALAVLVLPLVLPATLGVEAACASESQAGQGGKVLLVVIDRIGLDDLASTGLTNIHGLMDEGAVGLMNARARYSPWGPGNYLVLGAGGRALCNSNASLAFNSDEMLTAENYGPITAADIYRSRTGESAPAGGVVNISIEEALKKSKGVLATSTPGLLGETLKEAGVSAFILGNADQYLPTFSASPLLTITTVPREEGDAERLRRQELGPPSKIQRDIACIAMDEDGKVSRGDVATLPLVDPESLAGVTTDFEKLVRETAKALSENDFVVVDLGETSRIDAYRSFTMESRMKDMREEALTRCDRAVGSLVDQLDLERDTIIICTPTPTRRMITNGEFLTPLVIAGRGIDAGLFTSPTTRKKGLVSNYDLAPTILSLFDVEVPEEMTGAQMEEVDSDRPLEQLESLRDEALYAHATRVLMVRLFVILAVVAILILLLLSLIRRELVTGHPYFWGVVLLGLLAGPLVYLLLPLSLCRHLYVTIPVAIFGSLTLAGLSLLAARLWKRPREKSGNDTRDESSESSGAADVVSALYPRALLLVSGLTLILVLIDPFLGSPLMSLSPFGSDMILAGRYYGIGNTYMGIAIGAAILAVSLAPDLLPRFLDRDWKVLLFGAGVLLATVIVLGYPRLGANVGALITGVIASLFTLMKLRGRKITWKQVVGVILLVVVCLGLLLLVDLLLPGTASHAGKAITRIREKGLSELVAMVTRKISQNWKLMFASIWRIFFLLSVITAILWHWRLDAYRECSRRYPHIGAAWTGLLIAMVIAILFNDTGIESAGALMLYFIAPMFLLFLPGWMRQKTGKVKEERAGPAAIQTR